MQALYGEPWQSTFRTLHGYTRLLTYVLQATMATSDGVRMVVDWIDLVVPHTKKENRNVS